MHWTTNHMPWFLYGQTEIANTQNPITTKTHKSIQPTFWILHSIVVGAIPGPLPHVCCARLVGVWLLISKASLLNVPHSSTLPSSSVFPSSRAMPPQSPMYFASSLPSTNNCLHLASRHSVSPCPRTLELASQFSIPWLHLLPPASPLPSCA